MKCPYCNHVESKVVDSRPTDESNSIRRRRECLECQKRFTTYETIESLPLIIVKSDGSRQAFDRNKILGGVLRACDKRTVALSDLEKLVSDVEQTMLNSLEREIASSKIGELVMERLKKIDEVAYVRFASVYRKFTDVSTFLSEINKLIDSKS